MSEIKEYRPLITISADFLDRMMGDSRELEKAHSHIIKWLNDGGTKGQLAEPLGIICDSKDGMWKLKTEKKIKDERDNYL